VYLIQQGDAMKFSEMKDTYRELWATVKVTDMSATDAVVDKIMKNQARYEKVQKMSGVWWPVIAAIHNLEASLSFKGHLHNGDPLTAKTFHVPAGRPTGNPPFTWEESATDALAMKHTDQVDFLDTPEEILWYCERYNGWGYQTGAGRNSTPNKRSPYLWSKTNHWQKGKFVADGSFNREAGSAQVGVAAILKRMEELGRIKFNTIRDAQPPLPEPVARSTPFPPILEDELILQKGDKNPWVGIAQHTLNGCGYGPIKVDGDLNEKTEETIKKFQSDVGFNPSGIIDSQTWQALDAHKKLPTWNPLNDWLVSSTPFAVNPTLRKGDKGRWVSFAQDLLNGCGYGPLDVDSEFGDETEKNVKKFQAALGLVFDSFANGFVDFQTWKALIQHKKLDSWTLQTLVFSGGVISLPSTGFNRQKLVAFVERELSRNLIWSRNGEARKYTRDFEGVFGRGRFAWCGATVRWCLNNYDGAGGLKLPIQIPSHQYTLALVEAWQDWMKSLGFYRDNDGIYRPQPGDIVLFDWDQTKISQRDTDWEDHIGFHLRMSGRQYVCAEGNAKVSETGSGRTGIFVRDAIDIQGWAHIPDGFKL
jgi:lysozyme family protein/peptidoglycan hydrolase-like protein with peptidoglycan-binding domain